MTTFLRPRFDYASYSDLYRLVQVAGYDLRYLDEADWQSRETYILLVWNGETTGVTPSRRARLIFWNLERPKFGDECPPQADEMWCSDRAAARYTHSRYVFLGSDPDFVRADWRCKDFDVVSAMACFGRRCKLMNDLRDEFAYADWDGHWGDFWGDRRHAALNRSRLMVACHQDELPWCEPPRLMLAGSYGLPILSECCDDAGYWKNVMREASYDDLVPLAHQMVKDDTLLARMGAASNYLVMEHSFRKEVEANV